MIKEKNYSNQLTPSDIDTEYQNCNFSQQGETDGGSGWQPVRIFPGDDTPRTFIECNLGNAIPPPNSILTRCNTTIIERNRGNADHHHGRMNPVTFTNEPITPAERPHEVSTVDYEITTIASENPALENQIKALNGVLKVRRR